MPSASLQKVSSTTTEKTHYRLVQHNKRFEPRMLVVPVGSVVDFPNADPWFHNVFSLYRGKRFDLGLYQAGAQRSVKFDRIGPSYLFCNIHPEMTGVVLAVESELFRHIRQSRALFDCGCSPGQIHDSCLVRKCHTRGAEECAKVRDRRGAKLHDSNDLGAGCKAAARGTQEQIRTGL